MSRGWTRVAAIAIAALVAGCTSDRSPTTPVDSSSIRIANFAFSPVAVIVPVGTTVTWTNNDGTAHTTTQDGSGWDSAALAPGASFSRTFTTAGTFHYHCTFHPGMTATITVQ